jgi:hypothetical protein
MCDGTGIVLPGASEDRGQFPIQPTTTDPGAGIDSDEGLSFAESQGFTRWLPRLPTRRSVRISIALSVLLFVLYAGLLVAYFLDGSVAAFNTDEGGSPPAGGALVSLSVRSVDPVAQTMTLLMRVEVDSKLEKNGYEPGFGSEQPAADLTVVILGGNGTKSVEERDYTFPAGKALSSQTIQIQFTGYIRDWPFDRYDSDIVVLASSGAQQTPVPVDVAMAGTVESWSVKATPVDQSAPADSKARLFGLEFNRSLGTVLFGLAVTLVLISLPIMGLFMAISVYRGRRQFEPAFLGFIAALLFATVPLRNFLPGSPPPGSWVDVAVVLWVLVGLSTALVFCLRVWWRDSEAPRAEAKKRR